MKILLDECLPRKLKSLLPNYHVCTVREMDWSGLLNGHLMQVAIKNGFEVFITADKNLRYQQNISNYDLSIILLSVQINKIERLEPLIPELIELLPKIKKRKFYILEE
ncbi:MAG: DUF5615 family PIN-like protein [Cyclobacteriaceae bacterium]